MNARGQTWTKLMPVVIELLDEKHILLQMDDEEASAFLERRNWNGAVRIQNGSDFLMAVDTNMGYNKTNAVMETSFDYNVNLTTLARPSGTLSVREVDHSLANIPCEPFSTSKFLIQPASPGEIVEPYYNMDECHWGYLRVYTSDGTRLLRLQSPGDPGRVHHVGRDYPGPHR